MNQKIFIDGILRSGQNILLHKDELSESSLYAFPGGELIPGYDPKMFIEDTVRRDIGAWPKVTQLYDVISRVVDNESPQYLHLIYQLDLGQDLSATYSVKMAKGYEWKAINELAEDTVEPIVAEVLNLHRVMNLKYENEAIGAETAEDKIRQIAGGEVTIHTDGGSRGNPGPSAAAYIILGSAGEVIYKDGKYLGVTTNNQAEYHAVKMGMEKALELRAKVVKFQMDSMLVVNQMLGLYQIKNRDLWPIYMSIKELIKKFDNVTFHHVKREFNKEADSLVNKILDEH